MSRVSDIGDKMLAAQTAIGLRADQHLNPGLTPSLVDACPLFVSARVGMSELRDLFSWRNGCTADQSVPMGELWIKPGFFLLSAEDAVNQNSYLQNSHANWEPTWFPLLSDGSADFFFFDTNRIHDGRVPVFYAFPEAVPNVGRIYDSIELMLLSILECYECSAYFVDDDGFLASNPELEAKIGARLNPNSDYWRRRDLS